MKNRKSSQEIQDKIFQRMSATKKIKLASDLTMFCLKLNRLNENNKSRTSSHSNSADSQRA